MSGGLSDVANSLLDAALPEGGFVVSLVHAYFDESGTDAASPVMCVAGYLIDSERAKTFNERWNSALAERGLRFFHMVDCAHGNLEFASLDKAERIALAKHLIELIKEHIVRGFGAMMVSGIYEDLMPHHPNMGGPYTYCLELPPRCQSLASGHGL